MNSLYITVAFIILSLLVFKMYIYNFKKEYFYDKKYFWPFHVGMFLYILFFIVCILEFCGWYNLIVYAFPLWSIGPALFFYGLRRLMILQVNNMDYDSVMLKKLKNVDSRIKMLYIVSFVSVVFWTFIIIDGRVK